MKEFESLRAPKPGRKPKFYYFDLNQSRCQSFVGLA
jgi:hypothetical protein